MIEILISLLAIITLLFNVTCSNAPEIAGGGLDTESSGGRLVGQVLQSDGKPVGKSIVHLITKDYMPASKDTFYTQISDNDGYYHFDNIDSGVYNIEVLDPVSGYRYLHLGVAIKKGDNISISGDTLKAPAQVIIRNASNPDNGYYYIIGTTIYVSAKDLNTRIESVPAGVLPPIYYMAYNQTVPIQITDTINVKPATPFFINRSGDWAYSRNVTVDVPQTVSEVLCNIPVLLRFTAGDTIFSQVSSEHYDMRFSSLDGTMLPYEIERWDPQYEVGEIWVLLDTLGADAIDNHIVLFWGNQDSLDASNGTKVFDTLNGFRGVWHLSEGSDGVRNHGLYKDETTLMGHGDDFIRARGIDGVIGYGKEFNGENDYLIIHDKAQYHLGSDMFSVSFWYKRTSLTKGTLFVYKYTNDFNMELCFESGPDGSIAILHKSGQPFDTLCATSSTINSTDWHYLCFVRDTGSVKLYIDGVLENENQFPLVIEKGVSGVGIYLGVNCASDSTLYNPFGGFIDEVRLEYGIKTQQTILFQYRNQIAESHLIKMN